MGDNAKDPEAIDSDEEDEDYVPGTDAAADEDDDENDGGGGGGGGEDAARASLSITKQKAVDDAFFDLFGYQFAPATSDGNGKARDKLPTGGRRAMSKRRSILASIFGYRASAKLVSRAGYAAASARPKPGGGGMLRLEKRVVAEVKRFAGQEIRVERVVMVPVMAGEGGEEAGARTAAGTALTDGEATDSNKAKGVDDLLSELSRPEKLSTISKTSADWDLFKSKNADAALKEQLENQARGNEAYLVKKDFLNRVDERRFKLERSKRETERARRGKQG